MIFEPKIANLKLAMNIKEIQETTSPIFNEYGVAKASLFGSVSRGEDTKNSDEECAVG